jgi:hypothetical protein
MCMYLRLKISYSTFNNCLVLFEMCSFTLTKVQKLQVAYLETKVSLKCLVLRGIIKLVH